MTAAEIIPSTSGKFQKVFSNLIDENDNKLGVQTPLSIDGDSVYAKDLDLTNSSVGDFSGAITDLFDSLTSIITTETNNPSLTIVLKRPIDNHNVVLATPSGNFSNVTIVAKDAAGNTLETLDDSANNTKYQTWQYNFVTIDKYCTLDISFTTTDTVTIGYVCLLKSINVDAHIKGIDNNGAVQDVKTTPDGNLTISDKSDGLSIAKGDVTGSTFIHKFGAAPDFDVSDGMVSIWDGAEDNVVWEKMAYTYSTTADIDSVVSEDDGFTNEVSVQGLDVNYNLVVQTITLTGNTPVALTTNLIRVFRLKNEGNTDNLEHIFCYVSGGTVTVGVPQVAADIRAIMQPTNNQTLMAIYTVPAGKTGYMRSWFASTAGAKRDSQHTIELRARPFGKVFQLKHKSNISVTGSSHINHNYIEPEVFAEKTDLEMWADTDTDIAGVAAGFDIVLLDD